jgi:hypothetical protein
VGTWEAVRDLPASNGAFSPDGRLLAAAGASRGLPLGTVELIDTATGRTVARFEHPTRSRVEPIGFGPDPAHLYLRVPDTSTLDVWDLRDVRRRLRADFDLDWDWPEFPPAPEPPGDPRAWVMRGVVDWDRWLSGLEGVDWKRLLPSPPVK